MRKDFINFWENNDTELNFIENYWSKVWEKKDFKNLTKRVYKQEEYKLIKPFLNKLNSKSKLLDGGCGLGDWVIALKSNGYDISGFSRSSFFRYAPALGILERFKKHTTLLLPQSLQSFLFDTFLNLNSYNLILDVHIDSNLYNLCYFYGSGK